MKFITLILAIHFICLCTAQYTALPDDGSTTGQVSLPAGQTHHYKITRTSLADPGNLNTEIIFNIEKFKFTWGVSFSAAKAPVDCSNSAKNDKCFNTGNFYQRTWSAYRANQETDPSLSSEIFISITPDQGQETIKYELKAYTSERKALVPDTLGHQLTLQPYELRFFYMVGKPQSEIVTYYIQAAWTGYGQFRVGGNSQEWPITQSLVKRDGYQTSQVAFHIGTTNYGNGTWFIALRPTTAARTFDLRAYSFPMRNLTLGQTYNHPARSFFKMNYQLFEMEFPPLGTSYLTILMVQSISKPGWIYVDTPNKQQFPDSQARWASNRNWDLRRIVILQYGDIRLPVEGGKLRITTAVEKGISYTLYPKIVPQVELDMGQQYSFSSVRYESNWFNVTNPNDGLPISFELLNTPAGCSEGFLATSPHPTGQNKIAKLTSNQGSSIMFPGQPTYITGVYYLRVVTYQTCTTTITVRKGTTELFPGITLVDEIASNTFEFLSFRVTKPQAQFSLEFRDNSPPNVDRSSHLYVSNRFTNPGVGGQDKNNYIRSGQGKLEGDLTFAPGDQYYSDNAMYYVGIAGKLSGVINPFKLTLKGVLNPELMINGATLNETIGVNQPKFWQLTIPKDKHFAIYLEQHIQYPQIQQGSNSTSDPNANDGAIEFPVKLFVSGSAATYPVSDTSFDWQSTTNMVGDEYLLVRTSNSKYPTYNQTSNITVFLGVYLQQNQVNNVTVKLTAKTFHPVSPSEKSALLDIKAICKPSVCFNWDESSDPCLDRWNGVQCTEDATVVGLVLRDALAGQLPASISQLVNLRGIDFSVGELTGAVPDISALTKLELLFLFSNRLQSLPASLATLTQLKQIDLRSNRFDLPSATLFQNMPGLRYLLLSLNRISVFPDLSGNLQLTRLLLQNNLLQDQPIPTQIGQLTLLRRLDLSLNGLVGVLTGLSNLNQLERLILNGNKFTGSFVDVANKGFTNMRFLFLQQNQLTNIDSVIHLTNLQVLDASRNQLQGSLPPNLSQLKNLHTLRLGFNKLAGSIPLDMGQIPNLVTLSLANNELSGNIPKTFAGMKVMRSLDLSFNGLASSLEEVWTILGLVPQLQRLNLNNNQISGEFSFNFVATQLQRNFVSLQSLSLSKNRLTGSIPSYLNLISTLKHVDLSDNGLTGSIPEQLLTLQSLDVRGNQLVSSTPGQLDGHFRPNFAVMTSVAKINANCPQIVDSTGNFVLEIDPEYYGYSVCVCHTDYHGIGGECEKCPGDTSIVECAGGNQIIIASGYWPSPNATHMKTVLECRVRDSRSTPCNPNREFPYKCRSGHRGRLCGRCQPSHFSRGLLCDECSWQSGAFIFTLVLFFALFGMLVTRWYDNRAAVGWVKTSFPFFQVLSVCIQLRVVSFPDTFKTSAAVFSATTFVPIGLECVGVTQESVMMWAYSLPWIFMAWSILFAGFVWIYLCIKPMINNRRWTGGVREANDDFTLQEWAPRIFWTLGMLMTLIWFPVTVYVFLAFNCHPDGYLTTLPWVECKTMSAEWTPIVAYASITAIWVIAFPIVVFLMHHFDVDKKWISHFNVAFDDRFENVFQYVEFGKQFVLALSIALVYNDSVFRPLMVLLILMATFVFVFASKPYWEERYNRLETLASASLLMSIYNGVVFMQAVTIKDVSLLIGFESVMIFVTGLFFVISLGFLMLIGRDVGELKSIKDVWKRGGASTKNAI